VGIEALSNGAGRAVFVDVDRRSLEMVRENLAHLGFAARSEVVRADVAGDLRPLGGRTYDLIFLGPPYKDEGKSPLSLSVPALTRVAEAGLAGPDSWVILQHHEKESLAGADAAWEMFRRKEYGDTFLSFFKKRTP
jgi:16S rRNA (guanine(966)-N(2))-methyltransferase RsmD